jgi:iron complex outermembrane recepter protein
MGNPKTHLEREMTLKTNKLRNAISYALVSTTALAGTGVAFAQDQGNEQDEELDRIEIVGSRIKRADTDTSQPVFSLRREEIEAQGLTSVGDVIQNITANGSTLNSTFNNGGNGETRVSLRSLGSNRTLVLVNGRRWVGGTGLGGAVDLNTIPTAAVERIEVLKDGASTIYGSDAIAGVVNIVLRRDFEGAEANAYIGSFTQGDGTRQSYDFTIGTASDRWAAMFGVGYVKEEPVGAGDRYISSEPVIGTGAAFGSSTTPAGRFALCTGTINPISGLCSVPETRPNGTGGQFTYNAGQSGLNWRNRTGADLYNFAPDNYLLTPQERKSVFANGSIDITDNLRFNATVAINERRSEQLLAAMPIVLGSGPGAGVQSRTVNISEFSLYNPFGEPVSRIQRRAVETGGRSFNQDVDTFASNLSFEGSFDLGSKVFDWEAGYFYGSNEQNDTTFGLFNVPALARALGPSMISPTTGRPICVTTPGNAATIVAGCVPLNLLGAPGTITQEMLNYVSFVAHDEFAYKQKTYYANVGGDLFELPGGPLAFSFGLEHRTEFGYDQPDALINSGNTTGNARTATRGGYSLDEAYLEFAIPVLADVPGAKLLDFSLASRYSDYSNFGDTTNSKFGFRWKPIDDLMVRGNWSEGFRAPSIGELFTGVSDSFPTIADPCSTTFGGQYNFLSPQAQARCHAEGVPVGGYDQGNGQIRISVGGNVSLEPETAVSKTLGLVYSPSWLQGFDISFDWWKIDIDSAITTPTGQAILDGCIRDNIAFFCNLYDRSTTGAVNTLLATTNNIGGIKTEGYDLTLGYRLPENAFGKFSFVWDVTYNSEFIQDIDGDGIFGEDQLVVPQIGQPMNANEGGDTVGEYVQNGNGWTIRSNLAARWEKGDWGATWNMRFYDDQDEDCQTFVDYGYSFLCSDPNRFVDLPTDSNGNGIWDGVTGGDDIVITNAAENHIGATTYHDASVYWQAPWNAKITVGVNNVFAKEPPRSVQAFANSFDPQYEVPGRFVYMRYTQKF